MQLMFEFWNVLIEWVVKTEILMAISKYLDEHLNCQYVEGNELSPGK